MIVMSTDPLTVRSVMSGILAIIIIGAIAYLAVSGYDIPEILTQFGLVIVGFYFGQSNIMGGSRQSKSSGDRQP